MAEGDRPAPGRRVLVLGGYGGFGARIAELLGARGFAVIVAGRSLARARDFCARHGPPFAPAALDRTTLNAADIAGLGAWALVDATGPWQGDGYRLPRAAIAAGCHYLDIADARGFVTGIGALDAEARAAGVAAIAGASTTPALTAAVCDMLAADLDRVTRIDIALSSSNRAAGSAALTAAVLATAGKPVALWRGGRWRRAHGWLTMRAVRFDIGGKPYRRLVGLCDVPDHDSLPARYPGAPQTIFRAGAEIGLQNRAVQIAAWLVRLKLLPRATLLAAPARWVQRLMGGVGGDRSAMRIGMTGWRDGAAVSKHWELLAERGDGPWVPCLAVPVLLEKLRAEAIAPGARTAAGEIGLEDYDAMFAPLAITHSAAERPYAPLYRRLMGADFARLPAGVRAMHEVAGALVARGEARIVRGRHPLGRLIGRLFRFPPPGERLLLLVWMDETDGVETWRRDFAGREMKSELSERGGLLVERFGPFRFGFALRREADGLSMHLTRWWWGRLPMPRILAPASDAREFEADGRFHFDVPIRLPGIGLIVDYRGWLEIAAPRPAVAAPSGSPLAADAQASNIPPGSILPRETADGRRPQAREAQSP